MALDPAMTQERVLRAWLARIPIAERRAALDQAAHAHGQRRRAKESRGALKDRGTWYTPPELVAAVLEGGWSQSLDRRGSLCDPACGAGHFVVAAARRMVAAGRPRACIPTSVFGADIDSSAVALTRIRLHEEFGGTALQWRRSIRCVDALRQGAWGENFDLVVGNPPFLNQLRLATALSRRQSEQIDERFNGAVSGYADLACAFLLLACELAAAAGRVALVLPMSVLATKDALPTRRAVQAGAHLERCLIPPTRIFGAGVGTVVLVLRKQRANKKSCAVVGVCGGAPKKPVQVKEAWLRDGHWSPLLAASGGVPMLPTMAGTQKVLGDFATATADFRQHYYGLRGRVKELAVGAAMPAATDARHAAIATVGSVDAAKLAWGVRNVRLLGKRYLSPVADRRALARDSVLAPWVKARLVAKVIVATQTRVIEAWADPQGRVLPSTPLMSVMPIRRSELWHITALLLAPPVSAVAWWRHAGGALSAVALKLSAKQLLQLPAPLNRAAWNHAATLVRDWHEALDDQRAAKAREAFAHAACRAYGVTSKAESAVLLEWWFAAVKTQPPSVLLNSTTLPRR